MGVFQCNKHEGIPPEIDNTYIGQYCLLGQAAHTWMEITQPCSVTTQITCLLNTKTGMQLLKSLSCMLFPVAKHQACCLT